MNKTFSEFKREIKSRAQANRAVKKQQLIANLTAIKLSILSSPAVTDTLFMADSGATVCEQIDAMLDDLGVDSETLDSQYQLNRFKGAK